MKKMTPKKAPMSKLTPASASRIRSSAKAQLGREYVKPDKDSAAGAAT